MEFLVRIGDLAARTGVSASRIRFYKARGLLPAAARRENGYRDYPAAIAPTLRYIEAAQMLGFSLREIGATCRPWTRRPRSPRSCRRWSASCRTSRPTSPPPKRCAPGWPS